MKNHPLPNVTFGSDSGPEDHERPIDRPEVKSLEEFDNDGEVEEPDAEVAELLGFDPFEDEEEDEPFQKDK